MKSISPSFSIPHQIDLSSVMWLYFETDHSHCNTFNAASHHMVIWQLFKAQIILLCRSASHPCSNWYTTDLKRNQLQVLFSEIKCDCMISMILSPPLFFFFLFCVHYYFLEQRFASTTGEIQLGCQPDIVYYQTR